MLDERSNRRQKKIGWNTTLKSKPVLVNNLRELIREEDIEIRSKDIVSELSSFVHHPDGKMGAQSGNHDDTVIALGIAVMMAQLHPPSRLSLMRKREQHQKSYIPVMSYR